MIKLQNLTPEVYYKQSRDFQFIGRLYDVVLNMAKTNSDLIYGIPSTDDAGSDLIDLLVLTLGFKNQHSYNIRQLSAICSIFPTILRKKGSQEAIELVCKALLNAEGINDTAIVEVENNVVHIYITSSLTDLSLLRDILDYILPAGLSCQIIRTNIIEVPTATTDIKSLDNVKEWHNSDSDGEDEWSSVLVDLADPLLKKFGQFEDSDGDPGIAAENLKGAAGNSAVIGSQSDDENN